MVAVNIVGQRVCSCFFGVVFLFFWLVGSVAKVFIPDASSVMLAFEGQSFQEYGVNAHDGWADVYLSPPQAYGGLPLARCSIHLRDGDTDFSGNQPAG